MLVKEAPSWSPAIRWMGWPTPRALPAELPLVV